MFNKYWLNKHASTATDTHEFLSAPLLPPPLHPDHNSFLLNPLILNNIATCTPVMNLSKEFWEELIAYFAFIRQGPHRNWRLQQFFLAARAFLPSCYLAMIGGTHRQTHRLSFDKIQTAQKITHPKILLLLCIFLIAGTCFPSRCLAMKGGIRFTKPLPNNDRRDTHTDTGWWEGFITYTVKMGSGAMIYVPSFMKTGSAIQKLIRETHTDIMVIS
jgi:hypothetical protein